MTLLSQRVVGGSGLCRGFVEQSPSFSWGSVPEDARGAAVGNRAHCLHQAAAKPSAKGKNRSICLKQFMVEFPESAKREK